MTFLSALKYLPKGLITTPATLSLCNPISKICLNGISIATFGTGFLWLSSSLVKIYSHSIQSSAATVSMRSLTSCLIRLINIIPHIFYTPNISFVYLNSVTFSCMISYYLSIIAFCTIRSNLLLGLNAQSALAIKSFDCSKSRCSEIHSAMTVFFFG